MAEFCLDCMNEISGTNFKRRHVRFFKGYDLCEGCGEYKRIVAKINTLGMIADLRHARKEYKREFGKPYIPSKAKVKKIFGSSNK